MAVGHQLAQMCHVTGSQCLRGGLGTGIFGDDVTGAAIHHRIQRIAGGVQLRQAHVPQRTDAEMGSRRLALPAACVVFAAHETPLDLRVDDHHLQAVRHGHGAGVEAAAVDQQRVAFLAQRGDELVHDAAAATDEFVFGLLAQQGNVPATGIEPVERLQGLAHTHFERGR